MDGRRGICPVCNRLVPVLNDDRIGRHGSKTKGQFPTLNCRGWGEPAKEGTVRERE